MISRKVALRSLIPALAPIEVRTRYKTKYPKREAPCFSSFLTGVKESAIPKKEASTYHPGIIGDHIFEYRQPRGQAAADKRTPESAIDGKIRVGVDLNFVVSLLGRWLLFFA